MGGRCRGPVAPIRAALRAPMCSPASARIRSANPVCGGGLCPPSAKARRIVPFGGDSLAGRAYRPRRGDSAANRITQTRVKTHVQNANPTESSRTGSCVSRPKRVSKSSYTGNHAVTPKTGWTDGEAMGRANRPQPPEMSRIPARARVKYVLAWRATRNARRREGGWTSKAA